MRAVAQIDVLNLADYGGLALEVTDDIQRIDREAVLEGATVLPPVHRTRVGDENFGNGLSGVRGIGQVRLG